VADAVGPGHQNAFRQHHHAEKNQAERAKKARDAQTSGVSTWELAISNRKPIPSVAPTNSPITALAALYLVSNFLENSIDVGLAVYFLRRQGGGDAGGHSPT